MVLLNYEKYDSENKFLFQFDLKKDLPKDNSTAAPVVKN
jgi:hypothetical protein